MDRKLNTVIESIGTYLPPQSVSTEEIVRGCKMSLEFPLEKITGIKTRPMAGESEFSIDLAIKAAADCLAQSKYEARDIDLFVCCNISRYDAFNTVSFEPSTSVKLRRHFGLGNALVFDISNACAGMFTGIYVVNALIKSGAIRVGMVVSGEYITHLTKAAQREIDNLVDTRLACLTLGDAGAAIILEKASNSGIGFQNFDLQTLGQYSPFCIAGSSEHGGIIMHTDSSQLSDVAIKSGAKHAISMLEESGWSFDSFQHLIMHQTSSLTLRSARQEINRSMKEDVCHDGNAINNLAERGNSASTSHMIALADQIRNKTINSGDKVVFSISASGLITGTALYVLDDLPDRLRQNDLMPSNNQEILIDEQINLIVKSVSSRVRIESVGKLQYEVAGKKKSLDLLVQAAKDCVGKSTYRCEDIALLIYSGVYRNDCIAEPSFASLLAGQLDMNASLSSETGKNTFGFDIFNGALGFLNSCYVAQQIMAAENCETAMLVAAEIEHNMDHYPEDLVGVRETGSAIILDRDPSGDCGFSRFLFRYFDESIDAYKTFLDITGLNQFLNISRDIALESLYADCIVPVVHEILQLENLDHSGIDLIFPPQISTAFIKRLSDLLQMPLEKFVNVVGEGSDLFTSSIPYAFDYATENNLAKPGDVALVISVGSGLQAGCAIYHF